MAVRGFEIFQEVQELVGYHEPDWNVIASARDEIITWIPELVAVFYDTLYANPSTKVVFREGERPALEKTLEEWVASLTGGPPDAHMWNHQWFIGMLHVKRGVKNLFMLGMMNRIQQVFFTKCMATWEPQRAIEVYEAFHRISSTISAIIAECYGEVVDLSVQESTKRVGLNEKLLRSIREKQIDRLMTEARGD